MKEITQLAAELGRRLQVLNAHVTTAESCTGGGIAEAITDLCGTILSTYTGVGRQALLIT